MAALVSGQEVTWDAAPVDDPYRADAMAPTPALTMELHTEMAYLEAFPKTFLMYCSKPAACC